MARTRTHLEASHHGSGKSVALEGVEGSEGGRRNFAFVVAPKGTSLLMSKKKIGGAAVKDKQKECGGGQVIRGRTFYEDGKLVFETVSKISDTLEKKLRDTIKNETGFQAKPELRQVQKVEEIEDESPDQPEEETETESEGDEAGAQDSTHSTVKGGTAPPPPKPVSAGARWPSSSRPWSSRLSGASCRSGN